MGTLKLLRVGQFLALGITGYVTIERLMRAQGFLQELFAFISLVFAAIGCAMLLTSTDKKYPHKKNRKHIFSLMMTGLVLLFVSVLFGILCVVSK